MAKHSLNRFIFQKNQVFNALPLFSSRKRSENYFQLGNFRRINKPIWGKYDIIHEVIYGNFIEYKWELETEGS